jgi:hypothetical protein
VTVIVKELLQGSSISESSTGTTITRTFHVSGITGTPTKKALIALKRREIPALGTPHPEISFMFAQSRDVKMTDVGQAQIAVQYGVPDISSITSGSGGGVSGSNPVTSKKSDPGQISIGATAGTKTSFEDVKGNLMVVASIAEVEKKVTNPKTGKVTKTKVLERVEQIKEAEYALPATVLRVTRQEAGSPEAKARRFVGTINNAPLGVSGSGRDKDLKNTWLCTRIDGTSSDGGQTYSVTYEFHHRIATWSFKAEWIDPKTKQPQRDPKRITGDEVKFYRVYDEDDFSLLGIKFEGKVKFP